ncbi:aldo/keto reductase [uncultured Corynebacterium sp.]|uniref:aldo/keto reductase n=1 Tax=uncultured Corynebacterium sp. TaxID=159447 RepID=UPI0025DD5A5B|nr:aldo/keto reductase [uncultured Corynebacterium sp.]
MSSSYLPFVDRYDAMQYRRVGRSGLKLPAISLGLWQNFGNDLPWETQRDILRAAFDAGVTHFDLANNYGPGPGAAEETFGRALREDFGPYRDEMIVSTKAGYDMNASPYGVGGSRKYLFSSLDASLRRLGVDYVDIFYHHCPDPNTPLEESMFALRDMVAQGKALYVGISSYSAEDTARAAELMADQGCPLLIHQPRHNLLDRQPAELLDAASAHGLGVIAFSPLAQGRLTSRYLDGVPADSRLGRAPGNGALTAEWMTADALAQLRALRDIAAGRGQTLAQMALAWVLRDERVTSAIVGASSVAQLQENLRCLDSVEFKGEELAAIDAVVLAA